MTYRKVTGFGGLAAVLVALFLADLGHAQAHPDTMQNGATKILVNTLSSQWRWDDNTGGNLDPAIRENRTRTGWWDVWLGRLDRPDACRTQLIVPAGPRSQPSAAQAQPAGYRTTG